jgi:hypothetical protein
MAYSTINKSTDYFNNKLYTGTNATQSVTGVGFQPDMVWNKTRTRGGYNHNMTDSVRGATKILRPNLSNVESTIADSLTSFDTDGFSLGADASNGETNKSGDNYASWNWKAGTTASGNTGGSGSYKTYSSSSNSTSGFSIVKYTGNGTAGHTVPHGCGSIPSMIIFKQLDESRGWGVYHKDLGVDKIKYLSENIAPQTASPNTQFLNNTAPSSSVVSLGTWSEVNKSDASYVMYCFAEKTGFSKYGKINGNGNNDGPFIYTGFSVDFVIYTKVGQSDWYIVDNKRPGYNDNDKRLYTNTSQAEETYDLINLYSNGFKLTNSTHTYTNDSGSEYFYMACGQPIVGSNNVPANAR